MAHRLVAIWHLPTSFTVSPACWALFFQLLSPSCHVAGYPGFCSGDRPVARFYFWCPGHLSEAQHLIHSLCLSAVKQCDITIATHPPHSHCHHLQKTVRKLLSAKPDLRRTGLVEDSISLVLTRCQTRTWNLDERKNPISLAESRRVTGPWETRVPAAPEQLSLLRTPVKLAVCTDIRNVADLQCSSRTAPSAVQFATDMISSPPQQFTPYQYRLAVVDKR